MITSMRTGVALAFISLLSACSKQPASTDSAAAPAPGPSVAAPAPVDVGPAEEGISDYQVVMNALEGKKVVPADAPADEPDWADVADQNVQVERMGCAIQADVPPHCHMVTRQDQNSLAFLPDRKLIIVKTPDGSYSLTITSTQVPDQAIVCLGLRKKQNDPQTIEGTCAVSGDPTGTPVHSFAATLERRPNGKTRVYFAYRHGAFGSNEEAVHNGDGHATTN